MVVWIASLKRSFGALCFHVLDMSYSLVLAGSLFWQFLVSLASGPCFREAEKPAQVLPGRLQMKRPRLKKLPPEGRTSSPEKAKMARWRRLGSSWAAVGRQMAGKTALEALLGGSWGGLGGSWAALGTSLGRLWLYQEVPWRPRDAPGKGSGRPISVLSWMVERQKLKKGPTCCYFNDICKFFRLDFGFDDRLLFAGTARVRRSSEHR